MDAKSIRRAKLAELKAIRENGGKRVYTAEEDTAVYDEVDDNDYKAIVRGRLQEDDFIEDDGVGGYVDNGMDDWDDPTRKPSSGDEDDNKSKRKAKGPAKPTKLSKKQLANDAALLARATNSTANPYIKPKAVIAGDEDDFMASLFENLDDKPIVQRPTTSYQPLQSMSALPQKRKGVYGGGSTSLDDGAKKVKTEEEAMGGMGDMNFDDYGDNMGDETMALLVNLGDELSKSASMEIDEDEDDLFVKPALSFGTTSKPKPRRQIVNGVTAIKANPDTPQSSSSSAKLGPTAPLPLTPTPASTSSLRTKSKGMDWRTATASLAISTPLIDADAHDLEDEEDPLPPPEFMVAKSKLKKGPLKPLIVPQVNALEEDGSLRFWWYESYDIAKDGTVYLTGKVQQKDKKKKWVSAMVIVRGIKRKVYLLPREKMLDDDGEALDDAPEYDDVIMDFEDIVEGKCQIDTKTIEYVPEFVKKKYAFEIKDIPRGESDWVEATYPYTENQIPFDLSSGTFSHVLGTNTTAFERFSVDRKIMGPCWLNIKNPSISDRGISFCKVEAHVDADDIDVLLPDDVLCPKVIPPLTIISLSIRTVIHVATNTSEVVCVSARVWADCNLDDTRPLESQPSAVMTLVRPLFTPYPVNFAAAAKSSKPKNATASSILPLRDEAALLNQLLAIFVRHDPDVIVGYDLPSDLDVIIKRLKELKCEQWSRLSHFQRLRWPKMSGKDQRTDGLVAGRLSLDLSNGAREYIESVTWSLTEMCESHLKIDREDIDPEDIAGFFDDIRSTSAQLLRFVLHCEADTYFQMAILHKVQALLITKQLTNLAGNCWNKTLAGGNRAERNDSILVHKFTEKGYVCPDKFTKADKDKKANDAARLSKKKAVKKAKEEGTELEETSKVEASKEKYKGGLVFDPVKGLYDTFILALDFNSLYPSIIQEYDIDFTTIDWTAEDAEDLEKMPSVAPVAGNPQGILPQLIFNLVDRRRNVKRAMQDSSNSAAKNLSYNITQLALKLTANSMYGCLGFEFGRFYARPLASLVTFKGREILTRTRAEIEMTGLKVIYGDTDSVMIDTNVTDYDEAIKIGNEFKKLINSKYKKLEIEIDNVFERMLMQQKKKYAAIELFADGSRKVIVKGLDQKRREFCALAKSSLAYILDKILSGQSTEIVVEQINEFLSKIGNDVRAGAIHLEQFIIYTRLGRDASTFDKSKPLPHVAVALRMAAKGLSAKQGDIIPFVICLKEDGTSGGKATKDNTFHPDDIRRAGSTLRIDYEAYLGNQILPPVERLCASIEGVDRSSLGSQLGLDPTRYRNKALVVAAEEKALNPLQSQIPDSERFAQCQPLKIKCAACQSEFLFDSLTENTAGLVTSTGIFCANFECAQPIATASIAIQLELQIRSFITQFYQGWLVCDDSACENKTRMMSVYGKRCLATACRGQMHYEYSDGKLYNQLLYFDGLFNTDSAKERVGGTSRFDEIQALSEQNRSALAQLKSAVQKHLDKNGRRWVGMKTLFSFMKIKS